MGDVMGRVEMNVMTYDLSSNNDFHECPTDSVCALEKQVEFYMKTYRDQGFSSNVGYEVGQPAYPDPTMAKQQPQRLPRSCAKQFLHLHQRRPVTCSGAAVTSA